MMAVDQAVWHGEVEDKNALYAAIERFCRDATIDGQRCEYHDAERTKLKSACAAHQMLVVGQRELDGLLFFKARLESFRAREFSR